ncbi:MAG: ACP phosphodiesterase [Bacteroidota bacterium]
MNFLAHSYLSCSDEELLVGNFIADSTNNHLLATYPEGIKAGVVLHRKIDSYTDNHPIVKQSSRRLYDKHSKYASVIVDVYYDYLLATAWEKYHETPLKDFSQEVYAVLTKYKEFLPENLKMSLPHMISNDWLTGYSSLYGIEKSFSSLQKRASRPDLMEGVMESLEEDLPLLRDEFDQFFPEIREFVMCECVG